MPRPATDRLARPPSRGGRAGAAARPWRRAAWSWLGLLASALLLLVSASAKAKDGDVQADLTEQVLQIVNRHRAGQGLTAWELDADLAVIATAHSRHMAQRRQIGHEGFEARFAQARRRLCVENLAAGFDRPEPLLAAWLASPSHRDNLLAERPRRVGLGQVAGYVTLMACE